MYTPYNWQNYKDSQMLPGNRYQWKTVTPTLGLNTEKKYIPSNISCLHYLYKI